MKFLVIDCETTGLDPKEDQILTFSALVVETNRIDEYLRNDFEFDENDYFNVIFGHERISGSTYAIDMNKDLLKLVKIATQTDAKELDVDGYKYIPITNKFRFKREFYQFLCYHFDERKNIIIGGKNPKFDIDFLEANININVKTLFSHRVLDPTEFFTDYEKDESGLPNLETCIKRSRYYIYIDKSKLHKSHNDVRATAMLLLEMIEFFEKNKKRLNI